MISETDIYRSALVVLRQHGDGAMEIAQTRASKFWDAGDDEGAATWMRIARAIEVMQKTEADSDEAVH